MTAMAHEPLTQAEVLLEGFLALDTPEGFRAELIEGEIVVTPPPDGDHEDYIGLIVDQVARRARTRSRSRSPSPSPSTWRPGTSAELSVRPGRMAGTADESCGRPREDPRILPRNVRAPQSRVVANGHPG